MRERKKKIVTRELTKFRAFQARQGESFAEDEDARENLNKRKRNEYQDQLARGIKKSSGINRKTVRKELNPKYFMEMLTEAARLWGRHRGEQYVYWNVIIELFDEPLKRGTRTSRTR